MFRRYGELVARRARLMLVLAGVLAVAGAIVGFGAFGKLKNGGFDDPRAESIRAQEIVDSTLGGRTNLILLITAKDGTVDSPAVRAAGGDLASALAGEPDVGGVVSYWGTHAPALRSTDGTQALVLARVQGGDQRLHDRAKALIGTYSGDRAGISVRAGGDAAANVDVPAEVGKSLAIAEGIAVPVTMVLLMLAFGSVVAAMLPLAIGGIAILGTFAELSLLGSVTDVSVFAINLTTALGLGLGIDYALLLVSRFREQLAAGDSVHAATVRTVESAGRTIVFSAATAAAALGALLVFPLFFLRSFAYAGIGVVAIAAVAALVVVPALLAVLGHRVNAGRLPWASAVRGAGSAFWGRLAATVMRRPVLTTVPVLAGLLLAASPLLSVAFGTPDAGVLPASASSRQVADAVSTRFPANEAGAIDVVATGTVRPAQLTEYAGRLSSQAGVAHVDTSAGGFTGGRADLARPANPNLGRPDAQRLSVVTTVAAKSAAAQALVQRVRDVPRPAGLNAFVGGDDARLVDTKQTIGDRLPLAALLIVLTTFVVLFLFTGSVIQPLRALVLNALSLSATLGVLTWIFQDGHLAGLLGFTPRPMDTSMTVLLFCIVFGLSMDYEVIVTSRIKEMHDSGASDRDAVEQGLARTGRIVSTAAGLLAVSFFAFGTSSVSFLQMFGLGCGLAILIDATLVRGILVPAVMRLLGSIAWYAPGPLRTVHTRLSLSEA